MTITPEGFVQVTACVEGAGIDGEACFTMGHANFSELTATAVADLLEPLYGSLAQALMVSQAEMTEIRVKLGPDDTGFSVIRAINVSGTQGSDPVPANAAILINKVTERGGRQGRGRFFMPAMPDLGDADTGNFPPSALDQFNTDLETFRTDAVTSNLPCVLLHTAPGVLPDLITALQCQARPATQKRRLRR